MLKILIAIVMIVMTTIIHTGGMLLVFKMIRPHEGNLKNGIRSLHIPWIGGTVIVMVIVSFIEVTIWAATYLALNAIEGFQRAIYFSMVTYTTLGYGDVVLDENWRLLSAFEAANGIIMFGWTTAIVIAAVQHTFLSKETTNNKTG